VRLAQHARNPLRVNHAGIQRFGEATPVAARPRELALPAESKNPLDEGLAPLGRAPDLCEIVQPLRRRWSSG
jgi:hypothetical protein